MNEVVERVARAIAGVQRFSRFNYWTSERVPGFPIEICRYGNRDAGEPEIVVIKRFRGDVGDGAALAQIVERDQARAAIEAMQEADHAQLRAMMLKMESERMTGISIDAAFEVWRSGIDAALADG